MNGPQVERPTPKRLTFSALVSFLSGILTYLLLFFHSLVDMKLLLAIFLAPFTALIAIIAGSRAQRMIRRSEGQLGGKKLAAIGMWLGFIYLGLCVLLIVLAVVIFGGLVSGITGILGSLGLQ